MVEKGLFGLETEARALSTLEQRKVTSKEVKNEIGFDYESIVKERLKRHGIFFEEGELMFFDTAKRHEGSQAQYLLEQKVGQDWIFLSHLQKESKTSEHSHSAPVKELYDPLAGNALLFIDGKSYELSKTKGLLIVTAGQFHQLQTDGNFILTLIVMKNSAGIPRDKLHIQK